MAKLIEIIKFPSFDTKNGVLTMFQYGADWEKSVPFLVRRTLLTRDMKEGDIRGGHTHHKTNQILICVSGSCTVNLDNGIEKAQVKMDKYNEGLLLRPYVWHTMQDFTKDTILMVLTDMEYDEADYIRSYEDFLNFLPKK